MFKNGDIVRDKKYNEEFVYDSKVDGVAVRSEPDRFTLVKHGDA